MAMLERLRKLFSLQNPTGDWQRTPDLRLEADLNRPALNGIELGWPLDELNFLGPAEERDNKEYRYPSLGLVIDTIDDETFTGFHLVRTDDESRPGFAPFGGQCHSGEQHLSLSDTTETSWTATLGEWYWRDEDDDEVILFYEFPYHEWQVEFSRDGAFRRITITGQPLMAQEAQRQAYGVTKPWPPASAVAR